MQNKEMLQLQGNYNKLVRQNKELQNEIKLKDKIIKNAEIAIFNDRDMLKAYEILKENKC